MEQGNIGVHDTKDKHAGVAVILSVILNSLSK